MNEYYLNKNLEVCTNCSNPIFEIQQHCETVDVDILVSWDSDLLQSVKYCFDWAFVCTTDNTLEYYEHTGNIAYVHIEESIKDQLCKLIEKSYKYTENYKPFICKQCGINTNDLYDPTSKLHFYLNGNEHYCINCSLRNFKRW